MQTQRHMARVVKGVASGCVTDQVGQHHTCVAQPANHGAVAMPMGARKEGKQKHVGCGGAKRIVCQRCVCCDSGGLSYKMFEKWKGEWWWSVVCWVRMVQDPNECFEHGVLQNGSGYWTMIWWNRRCGRAAKANMSMATVLQYPEGMRVS